MRSRSASVGGREMVWLAETGISGLARADDVIE